MFQYPQKFNNWKATENHLSFLNFIKLYDAKKYLNNGILIKISFESEELCRVIMRKENRKVDYTCNYNWFEFEKKLDSAVKLLLA